ncbi:hypothetical protein BLA29_014713, partial [Euroglyphus maynei]
MTNRAEMALESITKALDSCPIFNDDSSSTIITKMNIMNRCAQIWTLKGDIQKDLHRWSLAIQ